MIAMDTMLENVVVSWLILPKHELPGTERMDMGYIVWRMQL